MTKESLADKIINGIKLVKDREEEEYFRSHLSERKTPGLKGLLKKCGKKVASESSG